jgi:hypothetical protein
MEDGEAGRPLQETRLEHGLAPLGRQVRQRRLHPGRQRLLLRETYAVGRGEATAQHARDRQEARRLLAPELLEAFPVEAEHAALHLGENRGRPRLPGEQRHLPEDVPRSEPLDPARGPVARIVHVHAQPSGGEHVEAVARLALTADRAALLDHEGIQVGGQLGQRDAVDLGE